MRRLPPATDDKENSGDKGKGPATSAGGEGEEEEEEEEGEGEECECRACAEPCWLWPGILPTRA